MRKIKRVGMIQLKYKESCDVSSDELENIGKSLIQEIKTIQGSLNKGYNSDYALLNAPTDTHSINHVKAIIEEKKRLKPTILVVIGIGGSNLGAMAIHEALHGKLYNETNPSIKVFWADTVDSSYIATIAALVEQALQARHNILLNIISKSGTTTETIANAQIFIEILKKHKPDDFFQYIVATTDKDSKLWKLAQQEKFECLEIPKNIGGRFSVFTACGLFPLAMLNVDIEELISGARSIIPECMDENIVDNPAAISAAIAYHQYKNDKNIYDTFLFGVDLESIGKWFRQLLGESIGKEFNKKKEQVHIGITPTVSIGSTDLHSVGQLYLGGPHDKYTMFIQCTTSNIILNASVPYLHGFENLVENVQGKSLQSIMESIRLGVQKAYLMDSLPYVEVSLASTAFDLGQLLQCKMLEIIYLGYLLNINPFDQPNVEKYKEETRRLLKHSD